LDRKNRNRVPFGELSTHFLLYGLVPSEKFLLSVAEQVNTTLPVEKQMRKYVSKVEMLGLYKRNRYTMKMQALLRGFLEDRYDKEEKARLVRGLGNVEKARTCAKKRFASKLKMNAFANNTDNSN